MKSALYSVLCMAIAPALLAEELTLEKRPFEIIHTFPATVRPAGEEFIVELSPETWASFEILQASPHGSVVKKGDTILSFETRQIDQAIGQKTRDLDTAKLELAAAKREEELLEKTMPHKLAAAERAAAEAAEDHAYFTKTRRKSEEDFSAERLKETRLMLENQLEELKQLAAMYDADDLTEQTEEIILTRQKDRVASAEFDVKMTELRHRRVLEVELPRQAIQLANSERDSRIALERTKAELPENLEKAKLKSAKLEQDLSEISDALEKLKSDRAACFLHKAPANGTVLHGVFKAGKWEDFSGKDTLKPKAKATVHIPLMTFFQNGTDMCLSAALEQSVALGIVAGQSGEALLAGLEHQSIPVKLEAVEATPVQGSHPATFSAAWGDFVPVPLTKVTIRVPVYKNPDAIVIPAKALHFGSDGWHVKRKLAEGNTERHKVSRGRSSGDEVEISAGLETGQVILVP